MFYLLLIGLILVIFYVVSHVLSSLFQGCLVTVFVVIGGLLLFLLVKSTYEPVIILDYLLLQDFEIKILK